MEYNQGDIAMKTVAVNGFNHVKLYRVTSHPAAAIFFTNIRILFMNKIEALKKTIYNLENDVYEYNWDKFESCNCGILAKSIIGGKDLDGCGYRNSPSLYGSGASAMFHCLATGLPLPEVYQAVKDAGFTFREMRHLEVMTDEEILKKAGMSILSRLFFDKAHLIAYLKAWVSILEESSQMLSKGQNVQECDATKLIVANSWEHNPSSIAKLYSVTEETVDLIKQSAAGASNKLKGGRYESG